MSETTYQITLSTCGRHTVSVSGDDPKAVKAALGWLRQIQAVLVRFGEENQEPAAKGEEQTPICAVHRVPMVKQPGKYGEFWSCHQRNPDGSFCSYRPEDR